MSSSLGAGGQRGIWRGRGAGAVGAAGVAVRGGSSARGRGGAKRPRDAAAVKPHGDPDADSALLIPLSDTRRAKVFAMHSGVGALLDIREMYVKEGLPYKLPGTKGISLTIAQVEKLIDAGPAILAQMRALAASGASTAQKASSAAPAAESEDDSDEDSE
jgi:hypothetical protein